MGHGDLLNRGAEVLINGGLSETAIVLATAVLLLALSFSSVVSPAAALSKIDFWSLQAARGAGRRQCFR